MCILIIDDDHMILELIKRVLEMAGIQVVTAENGEKGIQKFDNGIFDMVITDLFLPVIDGNGVARHIRNSVRESIPIIGISASIDYFEEDIFDCIISKPFSIRSLLKNVLNLSTQDLCAVQNV